MPAGPSQGGKGPALSVPNQEKKKKKSFRRTGKEKHLNSLKEVSRKNQGKEIKKKQPLLGRNVRQGISFTQYQVESRELKNSDLIGSG